MPEEGLPKLKQECTATELESLLKVEVDSQLSAKNVFDHIKKGGQATFIVDLNFKVIISTQVHTLIAIYNRVLITDCLIPDGYVKIDPKSKIAIFEYRLDFIKSTTRMPNIKQATGKKIREFLRQNGIDSSTS